VEQPARRNKATKSDPDQGDERCASWARLEAVQMKLTAKVFPAIAIGLAIAGCGSSTTAGSAPDVTGGPASDQATLFRAANLTPVLTQAKAKLAAGSQPVLIKIEPRDVKLIADGSAGGQTVTVDNQGRSFVVSTPSLGEAGYNVALISPAAEERAVNAVIAKAHIGLGGVSYVTFAVNPVTNKPSWGVYLTQGGYYSADANGGNVAPHDVGSAGGTGASAGGAAAPPGSASSAAAGAQSTATCIQNAGGDVSKIEKCTSAP
jgi:hypothetical protein